MTWRRRDAVSLGSRVLSAMLRASPPPYKRHYPLFVSEASMRRSAQFGQSFNVQLSGQHWAVCLSRFVAVPHAPVVRRRAQRVHGAA